MTTKISKLFLVVTLLASSVAFTYAQNQPKTQEQAVPAKCNYDAKACQPGGACCPSSNYGVSDLTADQKTKIEDLKLQHIKAVTPLKDLLKEKQARINTLLDAEKSDMAAINTAIDEFTGVSNQLVKKKVEFKLAIRNLLTEKQKIVYDSKSDLFADQDCSKKDCNKDTKCCAPGHGHGHGAAEHKCNH